MREEIDSLHGLERVIRFELGQDETLGQFSTANLERIRICGGNALRCRSWGGYSG